MNRRIEKSKWFTLLLIPLLMGIAPSCSNDNGTPATAMADFAITDAPIDDASVSGVFVTIADIQVGGKSISNFSGKQTINLENYTNGNSKLLGSGEITEGDHSDITLILDMDADADGNGPGCYVLTNDQTKYSLSSTTGLMKINLNHKVTIGGSNKVVFDFDLRKCVERNNDASVRYQFADNTTLRDDIRMVIEDNTGTIKGSYQEDVNTNADKVIVYAYEKGTFNEATETQNADGQLFAHAVASAEVEPQLSGNQFTIAFLDGGEYELHFAAYNEDNDKAVFSGMLNSHTTVNGSEVSTIDLSAGMKLNVSATINGIL